MKNILFVGLGGFLGSIGRYLISKINIFPSLSSIPINTLITNVIGSLLIGFLTGIALRKTTEAYQGTRDHCMRVNTRSFVRPVHWE